jgi:hypothetical protein
MSANRIDPTPVRMSTNMSVARQTPNNDFGQKVKAGLDNTANALGTGLSTIAPMVPGGPILSAAVSSMGNVTGGGSAGQSVSSQYSTGAMGVTTVGSGGSSPINTTVGGTGGVMGGTSGTTSDLPISQAGVSTSADSALVDMQAQQGHLLAVQISMQNESQVFSTVSNVLKMRYDTVKNTIQNVH